MFYGIIDILTKGGYNTMEKKRSSNDSRITLGLDLVNLAKLVSPVVVCTNQEGHIYLVNQNSTTAQDRILAIRAFDNKHRMFLPDIVFRLLGVEKRDTSKLYTYVCGDKLFIEVLKW